MDKKETTYKESGVDLNLGDSFVDSIKRKVKSTFSPNVLKDVGLFGSLYSLKDYRKGDYALISSVDGVGTKLKIAFMMKKHNTVGTDLVNHCINDIIVQGAEPLFFMDYISFTDLEPEELEQILDGFIEGCRINKISLIGGETAQMPGFYKKGEYDLVGFITGISEINDIIDGTTISEGDILIGLSSSGLHTNGYSLARCALFEKAGLKFDAYIKEYGKTLGEVLLTPHKSYLEDIRLARKSACIKGMAHITGGGIPGNLCRIMPDGLCGVIDSKKLAVPYIYSLIQKSGNISTPEMRKSFNMGTGMILVISKDALGDFERNYSSEFTRIGFIGKSEAEKVVYI